MYHQKLCAPSLRAARRVRSSWPTFLRSLFTDTRPTGIDASPLEDRTLFSATPLMLGDVDVDLNEDAPQSQLHLPDLFGLDDGGHAVDYRLVTSSDPGLFDSFRIDPADNLLIDLAPDEHGLASLVLRAQDGDGQIEQLTLRLNVSEVNDAPTMKNLSDFTVTDTAARQTVIDLFGAFDDKEDSDQELTFRLEGNTRASLFSSTHFDLERGLLILDHAAGQSGVTELTVVATDRGGLSVGMGTDPDFAVYDILSAVPGGSDPDTASLGVDNLPLLANWYFFTYENGSYDFSSFDADKFTRLITNYDGDPSIPIAFNIENEIYDDPTPEARDRFAEIFALANELRPDLEFGLYRIMPERSWYIPISAALAEQHEAWGLETWFTTNADEFQARQSEWLQRNAVFRTDPVAAAYGGQPLGEMVDSIHASLYTFNRNEEALPYWQPADTDAASDRFTVQGLSVTDGDVVQVELTKDAPADLGLREFTDYYVLNTQGDSFQLSTTPNGLPLRFSTDSTGDVFVGVKGPTWDNMWHDPSVQNWKIYAEQNIAEARKFDKPVYAWISPSFKGLGGEYLEQDFFRWQLEVLRPLVDGVVIFNTPFEPGDLPEQQGWWSALTDFMGTVEQPAGTVSISVAADPDITNRAPVASADQFNTIEDTSRTFSVATLLANDYDPDRDELTAILSVAPQHGSVQVLENGQWKYTPTAGYVGQDSFSYRASDGQIYSDPAEVVVEVRRANDAPIAGNDAFTIAEDQSLTIPISSLTANDTDPNGDALQFQLDTAPAYGRLSLQADGQLIYQPNKDFNGIDQFTYFADDGRDTSVVPAMVTLTVTPVRDGPPPLVAKADKFSTREDENLVLSPQQLLANDRLGGRNNVEIELVDAPEHGRTRWTKNGSLVYIPDKNYFGLDRFNYRLSKNNLESEVVSVQVHVRSQNDTPVARPDAYRVARRTTLRVLDEGVMKNDADVEDDRLRTKLFRTAKHGFLSLKRDGTFVYRPQPGFYGVDSFQYRLIDENGAVAVARAVIRVGRNRPDAVGGGPLFAAGAKDFPSETTRELGDSLTSNALNLGDSWEPSTPKSRQHDEPNDTSINVLVRSP